MTNQAEQAKAIIESDKHLGTAVALSQGLAFETAVNEVLGTVAKVTIAFHTIDFKDGSVLVFKKHWNAEAPRAWYVQAQEKRI